MIRYAANCLSCNQPPGRKHLPRCSEWTPRGVANWPTWRKAKPGKTRVRAVGSNYEGTIIHVSPGGRGRSAGVSYVRVRWDDSGAESDVVAPAYDLVELREPTVAELTEMVYVAAGAAWNDSRDGKRDVAEELLSEWAHQYERNGDRTIKAEFAHHLAVLDRTDRGPAAQRWWKLYARLATGARFPIEPARRS